MHKGHRVLLAIKLCKMAINKIRPPNQRLIIVRLSSPTRIE